MPKTCTVCLCPPVSLAAHKTLAHGETCKRSERKQWACQPAHSGAHARRDLSCTVLGCRSCSSVLTPSKDSLNVHRFFDLSKGFTAHSCWWLDFLSAQCAGCLLHPLLVHQAGILEELCVVLASYWSTLAPGEIEVSRKKCLCGVGLIFLDTKNVWQNKFRQRNACKSHTSPEFPERQWLESTKQYVRKYQKWKMYNSSS